MLKTVKYLTDAAKTGMGIPVKKGNHGFQSLVNRWFFSYFNTTVCLVDTRTKTVSYSDGGWATSSTKRVINSYREIFSDYREVTRELHKAFWNEDKRDKITEPPQN